jgi:hypothetical protein
MAIDLQQRFKSSLISKIGDKSPGMIYPVENRLKDYCQL